MSPLITLEGISKRFRCQNGTRRRTVLDGIDLSIDRGESVAILGQNGAGKSVLLKLITGIHEPTAGSILCATRPAALIELGAGFHPERDGRANLRAAFALHGMSGREVRRASAQAEQFCGLTPDDLDRPIKHYSSGMLARLGFAFVVACEPDLLISDEVLAVGDDAFQRKCIAWLEDYARAGGTLLLVSHNLYHVQKLCDRAMWLHDGRIRADGEVFSVCQDYLAWHETKMGGASEYDRVTITNEAGQPGLQLERGSIAYASLDHGQAPSRMRIARLSGEVVYDAPISSSMKRYPMPTGHLLPGRYVVALMVRDQEGAIGQTGFQINGQSRQFGSIELVRTWT